MRDWPQLASQIVMPVIALTLTVACVAVCASMTALAGIAAAAFPGANGRIAYKEWRFKDRQHGGPGWSEIFWSRRSDGTRAQPIGRFNGSLNFAPDGRQVVFTQSGGIGLARTNGRDRSWLLPNSGATSAALSSDGTQVTFAAYDDVSYDQSLYVIGADGANQRRVAHEASQPVFSPVGTRIAYINHIAPSQAENHSHAIETIVPDGTDRRRLVFYEGWADHGEFTYPGRIDFAPDGSKLLVLEFRRFGRIVIRDARTGRRKRRIPARVTGRVKDAVWSPDGRRIAFVNDGYSSRVFTIRPDGTGKRLAFTVRVSSPGWIDSLAWQPRP